MLYEEDRKLIEPYYETARGKLYLGDSMTIVPNIEKMNWLLTDPQYGVNRDEGFEGFEGFGGFGEPIARKKYSDADWDSERPPKEHFDILLGSVDNAMIFGGNFFADILPKSTHWIVWDKLNTMPTFGDCELIWTNSKRKSVKKYVCEYNGLLGREGKRINATQKPVKLLIALIEDYVRIEENVLDAFAGSCSTAIACERLKRKWVCIEKRESQCEAAAKRIEAEIAQTKLPGF